MFIVVREKAALCLWLRKEGKEGLELFDRRVLKRPDGRRTRDLRPETALDRTKPFCESILARSKNKIEELSLGEI